MQRDEIVDAAKKIALPHRQSWTSEQALRCFPSTSYLKRADTGYSRTERRWMCNTLASGMPRPPTTAVHATVAIFVIEKKLSVSSLRQHQLAEALANCNSGDSIRALSRMHAGVMLTMDQAGALHQLLCELAELPVPDEPSIHIDADLAGKLNNIAGGGTLPTPNLHDVPSPEFDLLLEPVRFHYLREEKDSVTGDPFVKKVLEIPFEKQYDAFMEQSAKVGLLRKRGLLRVRTGTKASLLLQHDLRQALNHQVSHRTSWSVSEVNALPASVEEPMPLHPPSLLDTTSAHGRKNTEGDKEAGKTSEEPTETAAVTVKDEKKETRRPSAAVELEDPVDPDD